MINLSCWTLKWLPQINKFLLYKHGYTLTNDEYLKWTVSERIKAYTDACFFLGDRRIFFSLEQVPDRCKDGGIVWIKEPGKCLMYIWLDGWKRIGGIYNE